MEFRRWWGSPAAAELRLYRDDGAKAVAKIAFESGQAIYKDAFDAAYKIAEKKDVEIRRQRLRIIELINEVAELQKKLDNKN